jgi:hypothetical protein
MAVTQRTLHFANHRVDPLDSGMLSRMASVTDDNRLMQVRGPLDPLKTIQAAGDDHAASRQAALGVTANLRLLKPFRQRRWPFLFSML